MSRIIDRIEEIRGCYTCVTNSFTPFRELEQVLEENPVFEADGLLAYTRQTANCVYLYWYAVDPSHLSLLRGVVNSSFDIPLITELVGTKLQCEATGIHLQGFHEHNRLTRMIYQAPVSLLEPVTADGRIHNAEPEDIPAVFKLLYNTFDVCTSHLPDFDELLRRAAQGDVFIIGEDEICGTAIFSHTSPHMWLLDQLAVDPIRRGQGYGKALLHTMLSKLRPRERANLWREIKEIAAFKLYSSAGFADMDFHTIIYKGE